MEYLVTMTTRVPDGTPDSAVDEIRAREAARSRQLAADGSLLRLWRPPLAPGEWRTLGLFAAADADALEKVLASMPLRVWRTDEVTPLGPHANDPDPVVSGGPDAPEFFTEFTVRPADGDEAYAAAVAAEAERTRELAVQGHLVRLWMLPNEPGTWHALGLWRAADADELRAMTGALPLTPWMDVLSTPLTRHPNDPATAARD
ncbi:MAG TPA: muconolactone Delta-isomerase family protein [Actinospica sp.]|jgi:muconolactone delta-isomerase|nr:muconolactone Delta-isomerase family protein [Actinospica sp.]